MTLDKERGCVLSGPDIVSRGFVYVRDSEQLMEELKEKVQQVMDRYEPGKVMEWSVIKSGVRDALGKFIYERTRRRPMIIPIIMEV
ncbi:Ribonuclease J2 [bioreactor metagenome]|uniref:Ribonuclease J2 n=1 Tax=bioreactor metagenome TaxID=1076179 RepID=A0A645FP58_9ZZZZ